MGKQFRGKDNDDLAPVWELYSKEKDGGSMWIHKTKREKVKGWRIAKQENECMSLSCT